MGAEFLGDPNAATGLERSVPFNIVTFALALLHRQIVNYFRRDATHVYTLWNVLVGIKQTFRHTMG